MRMDEFPRLPLAGITADLTTIFARHPRHVIGRACDRRRRDLLLAQRHVERMRTDLLVRVSGFIGHRDRGEGIAQSRGEASDALIRDGWVIEPSADLTRQYRLKIVSLETLTTCNQRCFFCPVSIDPRDDEAMPDELFDSIVNQLTKFRSTIEGVFLQSYNEPTIDKRFPELCRRLFEASCRSRC